MKHTALHKRTALVMALLVLFSTMSFTIEKHFCGNALVDVALFADAEGCGMEIPSNAEKSCCKDEVDVVKGQDELKFSFDDLSLDKQEFLTSFFCAYINLFEGLPEQIIPFKQYKPPLVIRQLYKIDETYLI